MSIRLIAQELYRLHQQVENLEAKIARAPYPEQARLKDQLRKLKAEYKRMRNALNGQKESPPQS